MRRRLQLFWVLFVASLKMFVRNRLAVFFSLFLPLVIMLIFGVLNFEGTSTVVVGVVDEAENPASLALLQAMENVDTFRFEPGDRPAQMAALENGERDMVVVIPAGWGTDAAARLTAFTPAGSQQEARLGTLILTAVVAEVLVAGGGGPAGPLVQVEQVNALNLGYIDFLVPGILGLTIMQLGLFGVAFSFVQLKRTGALRRLFATPTAPGYFLGAQIASRLVLGLAQIGILLGIGLLFGLHLVGSLALLLGVALLGAVIFLGMGFAIAGWAKNEDQAAPVANIISLPMMFLSGTFFPREAMPSFLQGVTEYMPLTFLNHALRDIANEGAGVVELAPDLLGMAVWAVISFVVAVRLFSWE
ncbi:MAG TPA: ABC transporter permease [candidate division Zixibacteria bacterium]|nr:ABC transporter permease [candidate division Zixibacteria bacterium]